MVVAVYVINVNIKRDWCMGIAVYAMHVNILCGTG